jgi:adenosylcobinamide-phosphate synthase
LNLDYFIIPAAVVLDLLLGDPRRFPHPVVAIGKLIGLLENRLRSLIPNERLGGILLLSITVAVTCSASWLTLKGAYVVSPYIGFLVSVVFSWNCLAARSLHRESALVADALNRGDLDAARKLLSFIVGRDTEELGEEEIWRGAVETVAENSSDGVIAPLFFLMLGGPVLGLAYKAVNTLDSMVGYKNERYLQFGWASARFDDLVNWLPARITGALMVMVSPFVGLNMKSALRIMLRDGSNHSSPNSGIPEAAAAGALGVRVGGANRYFGKVVDKPTIGDPLKSLDRRAWQGAVRLMYGAEALLLLCWWGVMLVQSGTVQNP